MRSIRRQFWVVWGLRMLVLALITAGVVYAICWRFGWHGSLGISNALFLVGMIEVIIAGGSVWGSPVDTSGSLSQRVLSGVRPQKNETDQQQIWTDMFNKQAAAVQALLCGFLTIVIAVLVSLL